MNASPLAFSRTQMSLMKTFPSKMQFAKATNPGAFSELTKLTRVTLGVPFSGAAAPFVLFVFFVNVAIKFYLAFFFFYL